MFQRRQLISYADNAQQCVGFVLVACLHKPREINRKLRHKLVQQLLSAPLAVRVSYYKAAVSALAFHHQPVGQRQLDVRRDNRPIPRGVGGLVPVTSERPCDAIQHRCFALVVLTSDDG